MKASIEVRRIRGSKPVRYGVWLVVGVQSFEINSQHEHTRAEAFWLQRQLKTALTSLLTALLKLK